MARRPHQEEGKRTRDEYVLTERGPELFPIVVTLVQWGEVVSDDHRTGVELVHRDCDAPLSAHVLCTKGHEVPLDQAAVRLKDEVYVTSRRSRKHRQ